jgi:hypothetical protein
MNLFVTYDEMYNGAGRRKMEQFRGSIKEAREEKIERKKGLYSIFTMMDQSAIIVRGSTSGYPII